MKKIICIALVTMFLNSCGEDFINQAPLSSVTVGNFYKSQADIDKAVSGVYAGMRNWPVSIYFYLSEVRSNNFWAVFADAQRDWYDISNFNVRSQLGTLNSVWQNNYEIVNRANEVLARIDDIDFDDESLRERYKAEVRFLRAFSYFQLVRIFGHVPLIDKVITQDEALLIKQSKPAEIYNFITSEISAVMDILPASYDNNHVGRVTKWAAKGILSRVYLTMAGYPLQDTDRLNDAKPLLEEIMNQEGGNIIFAENFADMFTYVNDNKFHILELQYLSGQNIGNALPAQVYPNLHSSIATFGSYISAGRLTVSQNIIDEYQAGDLRFDATIDTVYLTDEQPPDTGRTAYFSKFIDPGLTLTERDDWPINFPLLRYADVLLMYAEILNEQAGSPPQQAKDILNRIRDRADLGPVNPATKEEFRLALEEERRREFAFEGRYWFDLVRTGRAETVMNDWFQNTGQNIQIDDHNLIYPIPQTEIDIYPGLYQQNPGY